MRQPIQVLVYLARATDDHRWEYLLLHRIARIGAFWQGVTGGVEGDEEIMEAAKREMLEETELTPVAFHKIDYSYSYPVEEKWRYIYAEGVEVITEYVFVAQVESDQDPTPDPTEHNQWHWCTFEQALQLLTWPDNIEALKQCDGFLSENSRL